MDEYNEYNFQKYLNLIEMCNCRKHIVKIIRICILFLVLLGLPEQEGCDEQGTYNKFKKQEMHTECLLERCMLKILILLVCCSLPILKHIRHNRRNTGNYVSNRIAKLI
jgi:hypothetical protein